MKKEDFFPRIAIVGNALILNSEAIETMELDVPNARVVIIHTNDEDKKKQPNEILIMKVNGSLCDDPENIKDTFSPDLIRKVDVKTDDGVIVSGTILVSNTTIDNIKEVLGKDEDQFKLLVYNTESALGKEFKEQFDITHNFYRFTSLNDKRTSVGKEKVAKENLEERININ